MSPVFLRNKMSFSDDRGIPALQKNNFGEGRNLKENSKNGY